MDGLAIIHCDLQEAFTLEKNEGSLFFKCFGLSLAFSKFCFLVSARFVMMDFYIKMMNFTEAFLLLLAFEY